MKEKPNVLYLFIYRNIRQKANERRILTHRNLLEVLRRRLPKIPRTLHYVIICEMEDLKLIRKINKERYEITGGTKDKLLNKYNLPFIED